MEGAQQVGEDGCFTALPMHPQLGSSVPGSGAAAKFVCYLFKKTTRHTTSQRPVNRGAQRSAARHSTHLIVELLLGPPRLQRTKLCRAAVGEVLTPT